MRPGSDEPRADVDDIGTSSTDGGGRADSPVDAEILPPRPDEAAHERAPTTVFGVVVTYLAGFGMGTADVVPAFSGGTVAIVAGIYERLIANVRQGAHVLSLLLRGRVEPALKAFLAIEWPFVLALGAGVLTAVLTLSALLNDLLDRYPIGMAAVFLGLILGATAVAQRELREPAWYHSLLVVAVGVLTFVGLGWSPGTIQDPSLLMIFGAAAIAICAMILPGVSGAFLLVMLGMYDAVFPSGFGERDIPVMLTVLLGAMTGLALFSTALNYLLRRWHDLILAVLLGIMLGSARVLWPWPEGMDGPALAAPPGNDWLLGLSLGAASFAAVWLFGLIVPSPNERARRRREEEAQAARALEARERERAARAAAAGTGAGPPPRPGHRPAPTDELTPQEPWDDATPQPPAEDRTPQPPADGRTPPPPADDETPHRPPDSTPQHPIDGGDREFGSGQ